MTLSRRNFCAIATGTLASLLVNNACGGNFPSDGKITARPRNGAKANAVSGEIRLNIETGRDAILHLPKNTAQQPLPLLLMLHGATQSAEDMFWYLDPHHEEAGVAVLSPKALDITWDAITGSFGPDVDFLNRALERTFETVAIDPARVSIGGFSDGASYAISLGLINTDLFTKIAAFSPGFAMDRNKHGKPRIFISHGTHDRILPVDRCGRRIAGALKARGFEVNYREFDGGHEIPTEIAREGLQFVK